MIIMGFFSEWKKNMELEKIIQAHAKHVDELERQIAVMKRNWTDTGNADALINEVRNLETSYQTLKEEYDKLKEWSDRLLEISKKESSELASLKFQHFKTLKELKITEMNYTGAMKNFEFALAQFERLREENEVIKEKLKKYEQKG